MLAIHVRYPGESHHDQNAMKKLHQEKKNTRPYRSIGFKIGIERALLLMGLTSGDRHSVEIRKPMMLDPRWLGTASSPWRPGGVSPLGWMILGAD
jgi:hypothetical protein